MIPPFPMGIEEDGWTTRRPGILFMPSRVECLSPHVPCWLDVNVVEFNPNEDYDDEVEGTLFSSWDELEFG